MRILSITDLHGSHTALTKILADAPSVDLILLGGDITNFGTPEEAEHLIRTAQASGITVFAVAGNCDSPQIDHRLAELDVSLHGRGRVHEGIALQGLSAMPPWGSTMYQFTEQELTQFLAAGYAQIEGLKPHVVLSHPPPHGGKLDRVAAGGHVGSTALRTFVNQQQPALVLCGHIHEARGRETLGRTMVVNCGSAARRFYVIAEVQGEVSVELRQA